MSTQKTGTTRPTPPPDEIAYGETVQIGGREMKRVNMQDHAATAFADFAGQSIGDGVTPPPPDPQAKQQLDEMLPEFLKKKEQEAQRANAVMEQEKIEMAAKLSDRAIEARKRGDDRLALELQDALGEILGSSRPKRIRQKKEVHPALAKLRRNLGLSKIRPATIEWADSKWHFAPAPPIIDNWVVTMQEQSMGSWAALKISANLVGIDDTPLYHVFGIELEAQYDTLAPQVLYNKFCDSCGDVLRADTICCANCGSMMDPFSMPLDLRIECAQRAHRFFVEEFGPYEDMNQLYTLMRDAMPDRVSDREALYGPFLHTSPTSSPETITTPSGGEQSPG